MRIKRRLFTDLKPSNIVVAELDGRPAPRIIDFGIAKAAPEFCKETSAVDTRGIAIGRLRATHCIATQPPVLLSPRHNDRN